MQPFGRAAILYVIFSLVVDDGAMGFRPLTLIYGHRATTSVDRANGTKSPRDVVRLRILNTPVLDSPNPEERFGWNAREMDDDSTLNTSPKTQEVPETANLMPEIPAGLAFSVQMRDAGLEHKDWVSEDINSLGSDTIATEEAQAVDRPIVSESETGQADAIAAFNQEEERHSIAESIATPLIHIPDVTQSEAAPTDLASESTAANAHEEDPQLMVPVQQEQAMQPPAFARPEACPPSIPMPDLRVAEIKKKLSTVTWKDSLTKIASAFRSDLIVENIREVRVGTVDEVHLDVEALVCKEEDCVMVQVPVDFPTSCQGSSDTSQCILDNIEELNRMLKVEEESELFPTEKTLLERERLLKEVVSPRFLEYPSWWSTPIVLARDCENLRIVLNDADCQPQLQRLFRKNSLKNVRKLVQAAIVAVGPCGVLLRALDTKNNLHEVPIAFSVAATDAGRLRAAILELFD